MQVVTANRIHTTYSYFWYWWSVQWRSLQCSFLARTMRSPWDLGWFRAAIFPQSRLSPVGACAFLRSLLRQCRTRRPNSRGPKLIPCSIWSHASSQKAWVFRGYFHGFPHWFRKKNGGVEYEIHVSFDFPMPGDLSQVVYSRTSTCWHWVYPCFSMLRRF